MSFKYKTTHQNTNVLYFSENDTLNFDLDEIRSGVEEGFNDFKNGKYEDYRVAFERLNRRLFNE